jgi:cell division protein FtsI/penicillin-binding protein 2
MPVYNQSRSRVIKIVFAFAFFVIIAQLFYLQIISDFRSQADEQLSSAKQFILQEESFLIVNEKQYWTTHWLTI